MVAAQAAAYEKGKNSDLFKRFTDIGQKVGEIMTTVAKAGADGEFSEEERAESLTMWTEITNSIADMIEDNLNG